ncbi:MAG: hypothetical protein AAF962_15715 [Actinomycetota bacterium]
MFIISEDTGDVEVNVSDAFTGAKADRGPAVGPRPGARGLIDGLP